MNKQELSNEIINNFAEAYNNFGLNGLMGKIVALLIINAEPLSLDEISELLEMSKGPVSQIARRLSEHHLIEKVWVPGERKDYYRATSDIFGQAFKNHARNQHRNGDMARRFLTDSATVSGEDVQFIQRRMKEMQAFYDLMDHFNQKFVEEWSEVKKTL